MQLIASSTEYDRVVITHGTDTLLETAKYLTDRSGKALTGKVIVLTGAQKPEIFRNSDADFNVGFACGAALSLSQPGVYIAMNAQIQPWDHMLRNDITGRFHAPLDDVFATTEKVHKTIPRQISESLATRY